MFGFKSTAQMLNEKRGKAPKGMKWAYPGVYSSQNTTPTKVRNPKIAAQVNAMHDAWFTKKFGVPQ